MINNIMNFVYKHFKSNIFLYFLILVFFMVGISIGAILINAIGINEKNQLINFINTLFNVLENDSLEPLNIFKYSYKNNIISIILIWVMGIIIIGVPLILFIVMLKGVALGFTVGILFTEFGMKGLIFALLTIVPQNIFIIPSIIIASVLSINFALKTINLRINNTKRISFRKRCITFTSIIILLSLLLIIGGLIEGYFTPVFMKIVLKNM